jgi:hypothetical protein
MRQLATISAFTLAFIGGLYFGLFPCGGYAWHKEAFEWTLGIVTVVAVVWPLRRRWPVLSRIGILLGVPVVFIMVRAAAAPFYPSAPESWEAFFRVFLSTLERGPC